MILTFSAYKNIWERIIASEPAQVQEQDIDTSLLIQEQKKPHSHSRSKTRTRRPQVQEQCFPTLVLVREQCTLLPVEDQDKAK